MMNPLFRKSFSRDFKHKILEELHEFLFNEAANAIAIAKTNDQKVHWLKVAWLIETISKYNLIKLIIALDEFPETK